MGGFGVIYPDQKVEGEGGKVAEDLTEEQLLIASPLLFGFSLSDKLWREPSPSNLIHLNTDANRTERQ